MGYTDLYIVARELRTKHIAVKYFTHTPTSWYVKEKKTLTRCRFYIATGEWVPCITIDTSAYWVMVVNVTMRINTARARTRVLAFLSHTSLIV